jgi:uncharacterized NAD(P)/FAD-binding protein YdhS
MKTLVIIGSGFSGAVTAIEFLRRRQGHDRVIIVNRSGTMARGLAYGTNSSHHLLNVPAGNMTALVEEPDSFLEFCRQRHPQIGGHSFMPRKLYGEYLHQLLDLELKRHSRIARHLVAEVARLVPRSNGVNIHLNSGEVLEADHAVLAFGNFSPRSPAMLQTPELRSFYNEDPWSSNRTAVPSSAKVALLGCGLTALDVLASLNQAGHAGPIIMLSRRGLLPIPHRQSHNHRQDLSGVAQKLLSEPSTTSSYLRSVRRLVEANEAAGLDWRDVLAALRKVTPELWKRLSVPERRRFLRHLQPYWDVHRHRAAPATYDLFEKTLQSGRLTTLAGRLISARRDGEEVVLQVRARKTQEVELVRVNHVINCTGPDSHLRHTREPLLLHLIETGVVVPDSLGLGLRVNDELAVIDSQGVPSPYVSYVGPMLKAEWWEATAVPELRQHAHKLAKRLAKLFHSTL